MNPTNNFDLGNMFYNALLGQPQNQAQAQAQGGPGVGLTVGHTNFGPQMQVQVPIHPQLQAPQMAGLRPQFLWQPQAALVGMAPAQGQQWPSNGNVQPPFQVMAQPPLAQFPQPPPPQARPVGAAQPAPIPEIRVQELAAALTAEMQKQENQCNIDPSAVKDQVLVSALREGKAAGLTPRQSIVEKLNGVHGHTALAWMYFLLDHLERLYPRAFPPQSIPSLATEAAAPRPSSSLSRSSFTWERVGKMPRRAVPAHKVPKKKAANPGLEVDPPPTSETSTSREHATQVRTSSVPTGNTTNRVRRGDPVEVYHDETYIPPSNVLERPKPPRRNSEDGNRRLTNEDKVFFIHFLRWRLRKGPVPDRTEIYEELAALTPRHSADTWKQHWDDVPKLPDEIYIEARKRADREEKEARPNAASYRDSGSESSEAEDLQRAGEESDDGRAGDEEARPVNPSSLSGRRPPGGLRVTEDDLRAMAQFKVENSHLWKTVMSKQRRWEAFANRPENRKRSLNAWYCVERDSETALKRYVATIERKASSRARPTGTIMPLPRHKTSSTNPNSDITADTSRSAEGTSLLRKRSADTSATSGHSNGSEDAPAAKRSKRQDLEMIVLSE